MKYTDAKLAGGEYTRRSLGSEILLGLRGLSFTYDNDLIIPVEIKSQFRAMLKIAMDEYGLNRTLKDNSEDVGTHAFHQFLDSISSIHKDNASIFIPEVQVLFDMTVSRTKSLAELRLANLCTVHSRCILHCKI